MRIIVHTRANIPAIPRVWDAHYFPPFPMMPHEIRESMAAMKLVEISSEPRMEQTIVTVDRTVLDEVCDKDSKNNLGFSYEDVWVVSLDGTEIKPLLSLFKPARLSLFALGDVFSRKSILIPQKFSDSSND